MTPRKLGLKKFTTFNEINSNGISDKNWRMFMSGLKSREMSSKIETNKETVCILERTINDPCHKNIIITIIQAYD